MLDSSLTVAVTGPTGTFGFGLVPLLQADERVARIVGIARRPFDANEHGWTKMTYRRGDVRDLAALEEGFQGADVVVHLAFMITGAASLETIQQINVDGTLNAFRAAVAVGARRFVYASSVAAYGFHRDNPVGMTEDWPARPAAHLFYAQEKAQIERLLEQEAAGHVGLGVYLLRPPIVLGPDVVGAKNVVPGPLAPLVRLLGGVAGRVPLPVITPPVPVQFIHEDDVGQAFLLCIVGAGAARRVQHHRRRRAERRAGSPRARAHADPGAGAAPTRSRPRRRGPAVRPAVRRVGGGDQPPGDHGREQSQAGTRLAPAVQQPRGATRHTQDSLGPPQGEALRILQRSLEDRDGTSGR